MDALTFEGEIVVASVSEKSHIAYLLRMVEVEHFISEKTHKPNTLTFWVKVWCPTHL